MASLIFTDSHCFPAAVAKAGKLSLVSTGADILYYFLFLNLCIFCNTEAQTKTLLGITGLIYEDILKLREHLNLIIGIISLTKYKKYLLQR